MNKQKTHEIANAFLADNAEYFAQAFAELNPVFGNSGSMRIVSEEEDMTVVVGVDQPDDDGGMDVDCVLLDPDQQSLRGCIRTLGRKKLSRA